MYSACISCNASLGANEVLEHFPVGRRLAFDGIKGRLWVICPHCARWNLTPLEERWEAMEEAERLFSGTRLRTSTENIGLARMRDGTDLVRIGEPLRPELAAWRYGAQFASRRKRQLVTYGIGAGGVGVALASIPIAAVEPVTAFAIAWPIAMAMGISSLFGGNLPIGVRRIRDDEDRTLLVTQNELPLTRLVADGDRWGIKVAYRARIGATTPSLWARSAGLAAGERLLHGTHALEAARLLLPAVNGTGASGRRVAQAVDLLEGWGSPESAFRYAASHVREWAAQHQFGDTGSLRFLPKAVRLALEMSAHEDLERKALEGELAGLEQAWKDAEEIAAIADDLLLPPSILTRLKQLRSVR